MTLPLSSGIISRVLGHRGGIEVLEYGLIQKSEMKQAINCQHEAPRRLRAESNPKRQNFRNQCQAFCSSKHVCRCSLVAILELISLWHAGKRVGRLSRRRFSIQGEGREEPINKCNCDHCGVWEGASGPLAGMRSAGTSPCGWLFLIVLVLPI